MSAASTLVTVAADGARLRGDLVIPAGAGGIVLFAHGSGSSRHSPRNRFVAGALHEGGLATLLVDLLTPEEERDDDVTGEHRFDIALLGRRLVRVIDWLAQDDRVRDLPIGLFGASTGAAAALVAAAQRTQAIGAVVSRGGRPDLAEAAWPLVAAPTLLIIGSRDTAVRGLNRAAFAGLRCERQLEIVPGATHLFEEPGALERVAALARRWFEHHLDAARLHGEPRAPSP